jgi:hypothetical protein
MTEMKCNIIQTLIKEDERNSKPYTEYVVQIKHENKKWTVNRLYKNFCSLHASLSKTYPNIEFPKSANMFYNKTLSDIRKNSLVDGRRRILQSYISDIALIPVIRASRKFNQFIGLQKEEIDTQDVSLPQTSLEEIFDNLGPRSTQKKHMIPSDSFTAHIPSTLKNKSNPYISGHFSSNNKSKDSSINRSKQRISAKKDKLTLIDSFSNANKFTNLLYNNKVG